MAKEVTKREDNYSQWYNNLVVKADLAENSAVRGCMVIKPYGYAIWEKMQAQLDKMMSAQRKCTLIEAALFTAMSLQSKCHEDDKKIKNLDAQLAIYQAQVNRLRVENEELRTRLSQR